MAAHRSVLSIIAVALSNSRCEFSTWRALVPRLLLIVAKQQTIDIGIVLGSGFFAMILKGVRYPAEPLLPLGSYNPVGGCGGERVGSASGGDGAEYCVCGAEDGVENVGSGESITR
jgi:hypothetical protein